LVQSAGSQPDFSKAALRLCISYGGCTGNRASAACPLQPVAECESGRSGTLELTGDGETCARSASEHLGVRVEQPVRPHSPQIKTRDHWPILFGHGFAPEPHVCSASRRRLALLQNGAIDVARRTGTCVAQSWCYGGGRSRSGRSPTTIQSLQFLHQRLRKGLVRNPKADARMDHQRPHRSQQSCCLTSSMYRKRMNYSRGHFTLPRAASSIRRCKVLVGFQRPPWATKRVVASTMIAAPLGSASSGANASSARAR
jgi:hypothetical protein